MKILITGAKGFVGRNLVSSLESIRDGKDRSRVIKGVEPSSLELFLYDKDNRPEDLENYCREADFVFHLAGVNRPKDEAEFMEGNFGFSSELLATLKRYQNTCPIMLSSSIQASLEGRYKGSSYGESKRAGEELFFRYEEETGAKVLVYRFPNLFGKWGRPNYNSAIATFCYNVAHDIPINVSDPSVTLDLVYIDDLIDEMIRALNGEENREGQYAKVPVHHECTLGFVAETIQGFPKLRERFEVPDLGNPLVRKLYSTWLSFLPPEKFSYKLKMNVDQRGSFTEIIRTPDRGQFSINISKPGITKGNHWHHSKNEKFVVVSGHGLIALRKIGETDKGSENEIISFEVTGDEIQVVEMIPGYTHKIVNLSDTENLVTVMWADEAFDPQKPDTFYEEV